MPYQRHLHIFGQCGSHGDSIGYAKPQTCVKIQAQIKSVLQKPKLKWSYSWKGGALPKTPTHIWAMWFSWGQHWICKTPNMCENPSTNQKCIAKTQVKITIFLKRRCLTKDSYTHSWKGAVLPNIHLGKMKSKSKIKSKSKTKSESKMKSKPKMKSKSKQLS